MLDLKLFLALIPIVLALDMLWLGVLMGGFYSDAIGSLARRDGAKLAPNLPVAALVYLLIPAGLVAFVRPRLGAEIGAWSAFGWGAAFGLVLYGVYEATNFSVLAGWPLRLLLVDTAWGCVLCGLSGVALLYLGRWF
jgi:uncharacterized membrane protein